MAKKLAPIMSPKKLVQDMVSGKTIDEALTQSPTNTTAEGDTHMHDYNKVFELMIGQPVMVHTVTYAFAGRLAVVEGSMIVLEDASWVADLGQISKTFKDCNFNEVEHLGQPVAINCRSIIYVAALPELPKKKSK